MVENTLVVSLVFATGLCIQAWLLVRDRWQKKDWMTLMMAAIFCLFAFLPGKNEAIYNLHWHILLVFFSFTFMYAIFFSSRILPCINEQILLIWNLLMIATAFPFLQTKPVVFWVLMIPSAMTFIFNLLPLRANTFWKLALYTWFMIMVAWIGIQQMKLGIFSEFFDNSHSLQISVSDAFFGGMSFMYVGAYLIFLFELLPIPSKKQPLKERINQWKEYTQIMVSRFGDDQTHIRTLMVTVPVIGGLLTANTILQFMSPVLLTNLIITFAPVVLHRR